MHATCEMLMAKPARIVSGRYVGQSKDCGKRRKRGNDKLVPRLHHQSSGSYFSIRQLDPN